MSAAKLASSTVPSTPASSSKDDRSTPVPEPKKDSKREATPAPSTKPEEKKEGPKKEEPPVEESEEAAEDGAAAIDMETFNQILDLDEDETHEFSKGMAWAYFSQVDSTFDEMEDALKDKDLPKLSSLGHFLKGSSAALGVAKVQASCEQIQHYGAKRDEEANQDLTDEAALTKIDTTLKRVKGEYVVAEKWLKKWYKENGGDEDPET